MGLLKFPVKLEKVVDGKKQTGTCDHPVHLKDWEKEGWKVVSGSGKDGKSDSKDDGLDGMTDQALIEIYEKRTQKQVDSRWSRETLISKVRGL